MSYILEALKRADAERERGAVPGLHAQPFSLDDPEDAPRRRPGTWRWITLGFVIGLGGIGAGWWLAGGGAPDAPPAPAAPAAAAPPPPPAAPPAAPPATPPAAQPAAPAAAARPAPAPAPAAARPAPSPRPAARPPERVPRLIDLPEDVRSQIPPLTVGGAMYSDNAANRMLILNGQLLHEGDQPAPGLVLEQIRPKQAVLNFRGRRFEISY